MNPIAGPVLTSFNLFWLRSFCASAGTYVTPIGYGDVAEFLAEHGTAVSVPAARLVVEHTVLFV